MKYAQALAQNFHERRQANGDVEKILKTTKALEDRLPNGNGFARAGIVWVMDHVMKFQVSFQHEDGRWTRHAITIKPCFRCGIQFHISGGDRNGIQDHIKKVFTNLLNEEIEI